ncbi:glycosyltransferase family 4 protein [Actinomarinicola tropica]|uniref:Undecaprenyl/decaprenyl-phosphate alpha-N-acetylglucosaminyl 1-phosphate transferase n=1 Tax=Actinomarinicola tropica TaxID=2789776 RepID=A0A5Q2RG20_9ACTN|nr:MraY family glycosyltransferase [Actinomarinicola tropica]QGG94594.1 undecaprenyl/decaprenyl-phosphate alpha-N-acetylglucosaminyl 1-phosphate transferase [Actinomarinicola tropica]
MTGWGPYGVVLAATALTTLVATGVWRWFAVRRRLVVPPDERKVHAVPTATLGGIGMLVGFGVGLLVAWGTGDFAEVFGASTEPLGVALAVVVIHGVGAIDEVRKSMGSPSYLHDGLSAPAKMAGMVLAGSILSIAGVTVLHFRVPFGESLGFGDLLVLSPDLSALVTVLWVLGMANAINFIDGLDGLAAGIVAIASGAFFLYADLLSDEGLIDGTNIGPLLAVIVLGMCVGFLPWNVHPAKIFMGDNGALMLGLLMAAATISVGGRSSDPFSGQTFFFYAPLFIPLVILGVPIVDTAASIIRRALRGSSPAAADKDHLHHRLMRLGHGQWRSVVILWLWTALLSGVVLYPAYTGEGNAVVPFGVAALGLALYTLFHPGVRAARAAAADDD